MSKVAKFALLLGVFILTTLSAGAASRRGLKPRNYGYVNDLKDEKEIEAEELNYVQRPVEESAAIQEKIFNAELSQEFKERYERDLGFSSVEQRYRMPSRIATNSVGNSEGGTYGFFISEERTIRQQREFGGYVMRRLGEYHFDHYAKQEPSLRSAYEFKEKISNANVEVAPGYKFDMRYSLADHSIDMRLQNPFVRSSANVQVGDGQQAVRETTVIVGRELTRTVDLNSYYRVKQGQFQLVGRKRMNKRVTTSLMGSTYVNQTERTLDTRERLVLGGLVWDY
jgi:hypothetical protein